MKETEIGLLPAEWEIKPIGEISRVILGRTPPTKEDRYWEDGTIPFITPGDMQMYGGAIRNTERTITEQGLEAARPLPEGTVIVSCIVNIGKVGVVGTSVATTNQQSNAIIPNEDQADNWYINVIKLVDFPPKYSNRQTQKHNPFGVFAGFPKYRQQNSLFSTLKIGSSTIKISQPWSLTSRN